MVGWMLLSVLSKGDAYERDHNRLLSKGEAYERDHNRLLSKGEAYERDYNRLLSKGEAYEREHHRLIYVQYNRFLTSSQMAGLRTCLNTLIWPIKVCFNALYKGNMAPTQ